MHGHDHGHGSTTRAFAWVTLINLAYTALEAGYGFATKSLALLSEVGGSLVDTTAKANFRALGKRFGKRVQDVAKAVANADAAALSQALREGTASVEVDGETITLSPDEVIITETPREGW